MAKVLDLEAVLVHGLKDLLSAERQFKTALGKMAKQAHHTELKAAFEEHKTVTEKQIERLTKAMELLGKKAVATKCHAAAGLVEEGSEIMETEGPDAVTDAMLISAGQKVEHYEISSYGCVVEWATLLGKKDVATLMQETLAEEKETDKKLSQIAKTLNKLAAKGE